MSLFLLTHPRKVSAAAICPTRPSYLPCLLRSILSLSLSLSLSLFLSLSLSFFFFFFFFFFFSSPHKPERKQYRACYRHSAEEFHISSSCQLERGGPDAEAGQKGVFQTELKLNGIESNPWEVLMRKAGCRGKGSISSTPVVDSLLRPVLYNCTPLVQGLGFKVSNLGSRV